MAEFPTELRYLKSHEWAKREGDVIVVGISDHAQDALGDGRGLQQNTSNYDRYEACSKIFLVRKSCWRLQVINHEKVETNIF